MMGILLPTIVAVGAGYFMNQTILRQRVRQQHGASLATLLKRVTYGGKKGRAARLRLRRLSPLVRRRQP